MIGQCKEGVKRICDLFESSQFEDEAIPSISSVSSKIWTQVQLTYVVRLSANVLA